MKEKKKKKKSRVLHNIRNKTDSFLLAKIVGEIFER